MWKWNGRPGDYIPGIPARDIPDGEAKELNIDKVLKEAPDYVFQCEAVEKPEVTEDVDSD